MIIKNKKDYLCLMIKKCLVLISLTPTLIFSQPVEYPKRIVLEGITLIAITESQEDSINVAYIQKRACEKEREVLKDYSKEQDSLFVNAKMIIGNYKKNETEYEEKIVNLSDKVKLAEFDRDRFKKSRNNLWWTVGGFSLLTIGLGGAVYILVAH